MSTIRARQIKRTFLLPLFSLVVCAFPGAIPAQAQSNYEPYFFGALAGLAGNAGSADGVRVFAKLSPSLARASQPRQLSLADRVAYQRAIEEVYWRHRIWPKERPDSKPSLDEVMPPAQLAQKVEDYLRNSQALEDYWQQPVSAEQLQAEMERMAQHSRQPEVLHELFNALGNDPFVIAECLARPVLSERLVTNRLKLPAIESPKEPFESWRARAKNQMPQVMAASAADYALPTISGTVSGFTEDTRAASSTTSASTPTTGCTNDTWTATSTSNAPTTRSYHTAVWTGSEMIVWGGSNFNTGGIYDPSTDIWTNTETVNAPSARDQHTAVWTGSEMIVWGGLDNSGVLNTGGRYNPSTDNWTATSTTNAPSARDRHTAVWTGNEMIVWGGANSNGYFNTGGRYNSSTDSWTATNTANAPTARQIHTAVWTGSEMIVWGGSNISGVLNTGGRYNPFTDSWTATSIGNAPVARSYHTAVWTGSEMIVWGGFDGTSYLNTGGRYNPFTDSWTATSIGNAPVARSYHTAVWTSSEIIVWGGLDVAIQYLNTGGRYNPGTNSWTATTTINAPTARQIHTAVWTGSEMIVWGGYDGSNYLNTGGRYSAPTTPVPQSAFSRKTHGTAGTFDVPLPLTGGVGIECRSTGGNHTMAVTFATSVTVTSAAVTSGTGTASSFSVSGATVTVNLTGVTNAQRLAVTLMNVNDGTSCRNVAIPMGVLIGDTNSTGSVSAGDVAQTKARSGQTTDGTNFRSDVNASGSVNAGDVGLVKSKAGTVLPP